MTCHTLKPVPAADATTVLSLAVRDAAGILQGNLSATVSHTRGNRSPGYIVVITVWAGGSGDTGITVVLYPVGPAIGFTVVDPDGRRIVECRTLTVRHLHSIPVVAVLLKLGVLPATKAAPARREDDFLGDFETAPL